MLLHGNSELRSTSIIERALELGFDAAGIVLLGAPPHLAFFDQWLADEMHGEMSYMARHRDLRADPRRLHAGARSSVVVAMSHRPRDDSGEHGGIARYARGRDYHKLMRRRLAELGRFIDAENGLGTISSRPFVDLAPVLERDLAARAGIGWFGKNANIISQRLGSYLFLGELFVDLELDPIRQDAPDRCGRCVACIESCPTGAIVAPHRVDARRCISYLTIELRGVIPLELRRLIGSHLFGCDICQIVCPWNRKAPPLREAQFLPNPARAGLNAAEILGLGDQQFVALFAGTPVMRTGRERLARNAAVVLGNSGDSASIPALAAALRDDPSALVRGHSAWALGELDRQPARDALQRGLASETDGAVIGEIERALDGTGQNCSTVARSKPGQPRE